MLEGSFHAPLAHQGVLPWGVKIDVVVPGPMEVVRHDVHVVDVRLQALEINSSPAQGASADCHGEQQLALAGSDGSLELLAQQDIVGLVVDWVAAAIPASGVLPVQIDAVKAVLGSQCQGVLDEGGSVGLGGHHVSEAVAVRARVIHGPAPNGEGHLEVRVLLLQRYGLLVQGVIVPLNHLDGVICIQEGKGIVDVGSLCGVQVLGVPSAAGGLILRPIGDVHNGQGSCGISRAGRGRWWWG